MGITARVTLVTYVYIVSKNRVLSKKVNFLRALTRARVAKIMDSRALVTLSNLINDLLRRRCCGKISFHKVRLVKYG